MKYNFPVLFIFSNTSRIIREYTNGRRETPKVIHTHTCIYTYCFYVLVTCKYLKKLTTNDGKNEEAVW